MEIKAAWDGGLAFNVVQDGHAFRLDASPEAGGGNSGPRPKGLLLSGLAGCTGMDVVSILAKMRVDVTRFDVEVSAETTQEHPKVFSRIHIRYIFEGSGIPRDKVEKAVSLSQDKYCGVSAMLRQACEITHEIVIRH
jgi:putative redox protein